MSTFAAQAQQLQQMQQQPGGQQQALGPPQPAGQPQPGANTPAQGLPPTGLSQQLSTLNNMYGAAAQAPGGIGNVEQWQQGGQYDPMSVQQQQGAGQVGTTNVQQLARNLAQNYGLDIGRGNIVDAQGNFLVTPDQLAASGPGTLGETAAKMNYISQALARAQTEQQQQKGIAALQTGIGLVGERGRGSLAVMQSGFYQDLADLYSNQEYAAADFSYFIEKEQMDIAQELQRRQEKLAKKQSKFGMAGGILTGAVGFATGNPLMGVQGISQAFGAAGGTGWF